MSTQRFKRFLLASTMTMACFAGTPAAAQTAEPLEAAEPVEDGGSIVVTGSRIQRPDLTVDSPVSVIGEEEISMREPNTAEDLLRDFPAVRPAAGPGVNGNGSSTVDLRGIGTNRTLVLLDGRRIVPYSLEGVTDLNTIPTALLERVDVVTGGASSVYGADAVAGVVNFITKRNFTGVDLRGSYRITERGDTPQFRLSALVGTDLGNGRGNAVLGLGYDKRGSLLLTDRPWSTIPISPANGLFSGSQNTIPILFTSPNPSQLGLGQGSNGSVIDLATGMLRHANQGDFYNSNQFTYTQTPLERYSAYAAARYELTEGIEAYSSFNFVRSESDIDIAPTGTFQNTYSMPLSNAYLPAGVRSQLCNAFDTNPDVGGIQSLTPQQCAASAVAAPGSPDYREIQILGQRRFVEFGPRAQPIDSTQFQAQVGLRGDISPTINYDISAQHGETSSNTGYDNWGSSPKLQQAIRSYRDASGNPVCVDPSGGCVPINLFGGLGTITPDMVDFVNLDAYIRRQVKLSAVTANIGGDLFGLTSPLTDRPAAFSIGAEYRRLSAEAIPDAALQVQNEVLGTGSRTPPDYGVITVREVFGELIVPLAEDLPFIYNLQAEAGIRYSDYNTTGGNVTWKAGGSYEPFDGFKFRGMYQVAVRSPNIQELFQSPILALATRQTDPCQGSLPVGNPGLAALCVATGAPAGTIGQIPSPSANQINTTTSGNRNLDVERAKTYTLGLVITPPQIPSLSVTIDYFNIRIEDAISRPGTGDILSGCYDASLNPNYEDNAFCQLISRNPLTGGLNGTGETLGVVLTSSNLGTIETAGVDFAVNYRLELADLGIDGEPGALHLGVNGTWLDRYYFQATPNAINRDCTGYYSTNCGNPRQKWKWNARATYSTDSFDVSLLWTHLGASDLEPYLATPITPLDTPQPGGPNPTATSTTTVVYNGVTYTNVPANGILEQYRKLPAYDYFDLSLRFRVDERFELGLLVENLFDQEPPNYPGVGISNAAIFDVLGRTYTISARMRF